MNFYETKSGSKRTGGDNVGHMTQFSTNSLGYSSRNCPLQLQHRDTNSHSDYGVLSICKQKPQLTDSEEVEMVDPEQWFQDGIYISYSAECDETSGKSSYLCVQKKARCWRRNVTYSTGCVSSIQHHNGQEISMLFKLVRASGSGVQTGESQNRPRSERRVVIDGEITALLNEGQETD